MERRPLGRTGLDVSALAFNTRALDAAARPGLDLDQAGRALAQALDQGVDALSCPTQGAARAAAELLRRQGSGRGVQILSHVPPLIPHTLPSPHLHADAVFPAAHIRASTEAALTALGVERLAVQFLPAWQPEWTREGGWLEALQRLKQEGKIAAFGVAPFDHDPGAAHEITSLGQVDCVEVMYNIFDPEAAADLFPLCQDKGVGVVARAPLYGGAIAPDWGEAPFAPGDWRADFFYPEHRDETRERVARLAADVAPPDETVTDLALRFSLSPPAVATVALGLSTPAQVQAAVLAAERGALPPTARERLFAHRWLC